jgi:hypothetical protein
LLVGSIGPRAGLVTSRQTFVRGAVSSDQQSKVPDAGNAAAEGKWADGLT